MGEDVVGIAEAGSVLIIPFAGAKPSSQPGCRRFACIWALINQKYIILP
jgi:hypothetical protein